MSEGRRDFATLDGLRGVAALAVAFRHIPDNAVAGWTPGSYLAVDLFFALSGFVLAHAYEERLRGDLGVGGFAVVRLIRLYPLYLLASLATLALALVPPAAGHYHPPPPTTATVVLALLFVPDVATGATGLFPLVGPAWSLAFEFAVNLVFAAVAPRLGRRLLAALVAGGAAVLVAAIVAFGSADVGWGHGNAWGGIGRVAYGFFGGVAAYRLWRAGGVRWLRLPGWAAVLIVVALFHVEAAEHRAAWDAAAIAAMPAFVLAAARGSPGRWLTRPFAVLGTASYAVYVLANPLDQWVETLLPWRTVDAGFDVGIAALMVGGILALALAADRWYDAPLRAALTRAWRRSVGRDYHSAATPLR